MKPLHTSPDPLMLGHLKNVLESRGVECMVRHQHLSSALGALPPVECWHELWVVKAEDYEAAELILKDALEADQTPLETWICSHCGETLEGQFTACWNCGNQRPAS